MTRGSPRRFLLALIVVLTASAAGCSGTPQAAPEDRKTAGVIFENLNAALLSVSGTPSGHVYAVGADPGDGLGPYILHYDGTVWRRLASQASGTLWWISVDLIGDSFYMSGSDGMVLKYTPTNSTFEYYDLPGQPTVFGVWGSGPNDIWAVGGHEDQPATSGVIWQFDGDDWSRQDIASDGNSPILYKVWGRSPTEVYAVGSMGTALHYDGSTWTAVGVDTDQPLFTVHGNDAMVVASGGIGNAVLAQLSEGTFVNHAAAETLQMNGVYLSATGAGVAVGRAASVAFLRTDGWVLQSLELDIPYDFHSAWIDSYGGVWAVGGNLTALLNSGFIVYLGAADVATEVAWE